MIRVLRKHLDLASIASVADFAERFSLEHDSLHLLINNAGMMTPPRQTRVAERVPRARARCYKASPALMFLCSIPAADGAVKRCWTVRQLAQNGKRCRDDSAEETGGRRK